MQEKQEKPTRLKKGQARIEYIAVMEKVKEMETKGYDLTAIHKQLTESGLITMSYKGLYENHHYPRVKKKQKNEILLKICPKKTQPSSASAVPTMPTNKILSLEELMQKNRDKSKAFTESQVMTDENSGDLEAQLDKHIG